MSDHDQPLEMEGLFHAAVVRAKSALKEIERGRIDRETITRTIAALERVSRNYQEVLEARVEARRDPCDIEAQRADAQNDEVGL